MVTLVNLTFEQEVAQAFVQACRLVLTYAVDGIGVEVVASATVEVLDGYVTSRECVHL